MPSDHNTRSLSLGGQYNRGGYRFRVGGSRNQRSKWEPWGFADNPDFDLKKTRIESYVRERDDAFVDGQDKVEIKGRLKGMQRLLRLTGRYDGMRALMNDGIHSSLAAARLPKREFLRRYADSLGGTAGAAWAYSKASHHLRGQGLCIVSAFQ